MRKILFGILAVGVLGALVMPGLVAAVGENGDCCPGGVTSDDCDPGLTCVGFRDDDHDAVCVDDQDSPNDRVGQCRISATTVGGPNECCQLANDVSKVNTVCQKGMVVGPSADAVCDIEGGVNTVTGAWAMCCTVDIVYKVTNWIFFLMLIISVLMVIAGGVLYMTAAGNTERTGTGKSLILYAIIGLAIGILAKIIPSIVTFIV